MENMELHLNLAMMEDIEFDKKVDVDDLVLPLKPIKLAEIEINYIMQEPLEEKNQHTTSESDHDVGKKFKVKMEENILKLYEKLDKEKSEDSTMDFSLIRSLKIKQFVNGIAEHERFHEIKPCTFCEKSFLQVHEVKEHIKIHKSISEVEDLKNQVKTLKTQVEELELKLENSQKNEFKENAKMEDKQGMSKLGVDQEKVKYILDLEQRKVIQEANNETVLEVPKIKVKSPKKVDLSKSTELCETVTHLPEGDSKQEYENVMNQPKALKTDRKQIQKVRKQYLCQYCEKEFKQSSHLKAHEMIHSGEKPNSCQYCSQQFRQLTDLKRHVMVHTKEKPYSCKICSRQFSRIGNLRLHESIHTGDKLFPCQYCSYKSSTLANVKKHEMVHSKEKPYHCKTCSKQFSRVGNLKVHEKIHNGEKLFTCQYCEKKFNEKGNLKRHENQIHINEKTFPCVFIVEKS